MGRSSAIRTIQLLTKIRWTAPSVNANPYIYPIRLCWTSVLGINRQYYLNHSDRKKQGSCLVHHHGSHFPQPSIMGGQLSALHTSSNLSHDSNINMEQFDRKVTISQPSKTDPDKVLTFEMSVLDTFPEDVEQERYTVVAIHGIPGTGHDFLSLALKLREKGIRTVAPTSLGMETSPIDINQMSEIDFTTKGRTRNLQLVLVAMNIHRVDMLLGHSAGAWVVYEAGSQWTNISSICGINPGGVEPNRRIRPFAVHKFLAGLLWRPFFRRLLVPVIPVAYRVLGFKGISVKKGVTHLITAQMYITQQGFEDVPGNAAMIQYKQLPILIAYALNDKFIEPAICATMAHNQLGIPITNVVMYADDKTPNRDPFFVPEGVLSRCLVFLRGGHIVHIAHEAELVEQIADIFKHVAARKASMKTLFDNVQKTASFSS